MPLIHCNTETTEGQKISWEEKGALGQVSIQGNLMDEFSSTHEYMYTHDFSSTGGALFPHLSVS